MTNLSIRETKRVETNAFATPAYKKRSVISMYEVVKKGKEFHEVHFEELETLDEALSCASLLWRELTWREKKKTSVEIWDDEGCVTLPISLTLYVKKGDAAITDGKLECSAIDSNKNDYVVRWWTYGETDKHEIMCEDKNLYEVEELKKRYTLELEENILPRDVEIEIEIIKEEK